MLNITVKSYTMPTVAFHRSCSDPCRRPVALCRTCRGRHSVVAVNLTSVDVLRFSNLAACAPYAHMPRTQKPAQITTCTVVCCDSDQGPVCDGPFTSQHDIARDTKARITAKMKLESSLLHICPKRVHERPTSIGALPVDQCTLIRSERR